MKPVDLYGAVILDAIEVLRAPESTVNRYQRHSTPHLVERHHREEIRWFLSDDESEAFSFVRCCRIVGLDPEAVRDHLRRGRLLPALRRAAA